MNLIEEAYTELFPDEGFPFTVTIKYSGKFSDYNANIRMIKNYHDSSQTLIINLSRKWEEVSPEIKKGLVQSLLVKLLKRKRKTMAMDLYNMFIKNLHISLPKTQADPALSQSFMRVNDRYFDGQLEAPNLVFGQNTFRKLASYSFASDRITFSGILKKADDEIVDYIMYHELLHKKLKYRSTGLRDTFHTGEFRRLERSFENSEEIEKRIKSLLIRKRFLSLF